jgi:copper(I)-binding protein
MIRRTCSLALLVIASGCATTETPASSIVVAGPAIIRNAPDSGADVQAAGYIRLRNNAGQADRLVALSCACADDVQMHSTFDRAMHVLPHMDIPPNGELEVRPGGPTHLMLMGVRSPIAAGDVVRIRLVFERSAPIEAPFVAVENSQEGWRANDSR